MKVQAICLVMLATLQAQLAGARMSGEMVENSMVMSRRASDAVIAAHALRRRGSSSGSASTKAKRGKCPVKQKPIKNDFEPSASSSSSSSISEDAQPTSTSTKNEEPKETPKEQPKPDNKPVEKPQTPVEQPKPEPPKEEPKPEPQPQPQQPSNNGGSANAVLGSVNKFLGVNSGIGSWFRTNRGSDSTNGRSWCETQYHDDWLCFAPSVGTMISDFGGDQQAAKKAYCGREVKLTNPNNGNQLTGFICDGFDDRWVLSPGSIDLSIAAFTRLHGGFDDNKNTVIKGVQWEFTGGVVSKGTRKSPESQGNTNY